MLIHFMLYAFCFSMRKSAGKGQTVGLREREMDKCPGSGKAEFLRQGVCWNRMGRRWGANVGPGGQDGRLRGTISRLWASCE